MTTQRIIDNIQERLETLVGDRFTGTYHNIDINCSNYNPDIDTTITVTITVTDQNNDPVEDYTVPLKIDGTGITGVTTNSSGVATYNYSCNTWGVHKISVKSVSAFINVGGWRTFIDNGPYTGKYNDEYVSLKINATNITFTSTWTEFAVDVIPDSNPDLRPTQYIALPTGGNARNFVRIKNNSRRVERATLAGQTLTDQTMALEFLYKRKPE